MAVPTADDLRTYYPYKLNIADGAVSPELTVDSAGADYIVDATLTQANDYWNGAIIRFEADTTTAALRGTYAHVMDFVAADDKLIFSKDLAATPANTDTFRIFFGGNWRTSHEVPGLTASAPVDVTGVTILQTAYYSGTGNGTLAYDSGDDTLTWKAPGDSNAGAKVDVSGAGAGTAYIIYSEDTNKWIEVWVVFATLPVGSENDTIALTQPEGIVLPDFEGYEYSGGKTRYHLVVVKNGDGVNSMVDLRAWLEPDEDGTDTTTTTTRAATAGTLGLTDASDWPVRDFWIYNSTRSDCRYVTYRSGNTLHCEAAGAGLRGCAAAAWQIGDTVLVMPEVDIGLDAPVADQFESPANETTAPGGVSFSAPKTYAEALVIGTLIGGTIYGIWVREVVLAAGHARGDIDNALNFQWR